MLSTISRYQNGPERKRRAHAKSRRGCGNCKLRRIKCDETRPHCRRCSDYGVSCGYNGKASMDLSAEGSFQVDLTQERKEPPKDKKTYSALFSSVYRPPVSVTQSIVTEFMNVLEADSWLEPGSFHRTNYWTFTAKDLQTLHNFRMRTVSTVGTKGSALIYRDYVCPLAFSNPYLMHILLTLTLFHEAYLATDPAVADERTHKGLRHWQLGTTLYNRVLSKPIAPESRDAIWAAAAMIGCITFAYVESRNVEELWPLKPSEDNDLAWIKLSDGKKAIWKIAEPTRPDSVFREMLKDPAFQHDRKLIEQNDLSNVPEDMLRMFDITPASTPDRNPYHFPVLTLARLQSMQPTHENLLVFLLFIGHMSLEFRNLLEIKDPRAVLLLGAWFKTLEDCELWWLRQRARLQSHAVRLWLRRSFGDIDTATLFEKISVQSEDAQLDREPLSFGEGLADDCMMQ